MKKQPDIFTLKAMRGKLKKALNSFLSDLENAKSQRVPLKVNYLKKRRIAFDKMKQTRKSVDAYLDKLEANAVAEIDELIDKETNSLDEQISICNASVSFLTSSLSSLNRMMSVGNNEEKFVETNIATKQIKQYCSMLRDMGHELRNIDIEFEENEKVSNLSRILQDLGKCSINSFSVSSVTMEMTPIYTREIQLTTNKGLGDRHNTGNGGQQEEASHTDDEAPFITSFDILPDGRTLLMDNINKTLKLYDQNNFFVTEHVLSVSLDDKPLHFVILSSTEAVVTHWNNTLLEVKVGDGFAVTEMKLDYIIGPVNRCGEDIIALLTVSDIAQVSVLDKHLSIKKTIIQDDNETLFRTPVTLAASADKSMLFVVDYDNGCYGFTMDGEVRFHYQDPKGKGYFGLVVGKDCLFVGAEVDENRAQVQTLNFSGARLACADFGDSCPLGLIDNELFC
ncbi:MAG: hypothetical protein AB2693_20430 [Candidatus Thiodiazotropha sp.]